MFEPDKKGYLQARAAYFIKRLDQQISRHLNRVLHHPQFKALESSWRNLAYLVANATMGNNVKVCFLPLNKAELANDLLYALEFDQSQLFDKVYHQGFGIAGGEPFGILLGDYEFSHAPSDIQILQALSQIAAAIFAPFIAGAAPALLGLNHFFELGRQPKLVNVFQQQEYSAWQQLRKQEDMRFIALSLPRHLVRLPYCTLKSGGSFQYHETSDDIAYLWGNAAYAFVAVLIRNFLANAWFGNIRGNFPEQHQGGRMPPILAEDQTQRLARSTLVDALITDQQEKELSELGLIGLCQSNTSGEAVFYSNNSVQQINATQNTSHYTNAKAGSMLQYLLCACRFAHYLKVIARDKIGSFYTPEECTEMLTKWLLHYVAGNNDLGLTQRAKYPLQSGLIKVTEQPAMPGSYFCKMQLKPFFQLEQLHAEFIFITSLDISRGALR